VVLRKGQLLGGTYTGRAGLTSGLPGARAVRLKKKSANEGAQLSGGPGDDLAARHSAAIAIPAGGLQ
jgi:hypothetical protein